MLALLVLAAGTLSFASLHLGHNWGDDFALYIRQALSLAEGWIPRMAEDNRFSMSESRVWMGPALYPWGLPVLLAPVIALAGVDFIVLKSFVGLFFLLFLVASFLLFRHRLTSPWQALVVVAALGLNPAMYRFTDNVVSELPHIAFTVLALHWIVRDYSDDRPIGGPWLSRLTIGLLIGVACWIRQPGVALLPALVVAQIVRFPRSVARPGAAPVAASHALPYLAFGGFWLGTQLILPDHAGQRLDVLSATTVSMVLGNLRYLVHLPREAFDPYFGTLVLGMTLPFVALGVARRWREDVALLVFSAATFGILLVWPAHIGLRGLFAVLPVFFYFLVHGLAIASRHVRPSGSRAAPALPVLVWPMVIYFTLLPVITPGELRFLASNLRDRAVVDGPYTPASLEMFRVVTANTDSSDVVFFYKPRALTLITGRRSIAEPSLAAITADRGALAVIHKRMGAYHQVPPDSVAELRAPQLQPVFENQDFLVLRVGPSGPTPPAAPAASPGGPTDAAASRTGSGTQGR